MNKDFKSYQDVWLTHETAWGGSNATGITSDLSEAYELAKQASNAIANSGLEGVTPISINMSESKIMDLETDREKLAIFCQKIHMDAEDRIDDIFNYGVMTTLADIYALNPSDITCTSLGVEYHLTSIMETVIIDPVLKAEFTDQSKNLDQDDLTDDLKTEVINAVNRYYDGDVTPYMTNVSGYDTTAFQKDMELVIEYYEYLNPMDATHMDEFLSDIEKDNDSKYDQDIRNIKFIAYTAREPYRSVFFQYVDQLDIGDYNYPETDSKGNGLAQHYSPDDKELFVRLYGTDSSGANDEGKYDPRGAYVTFFHEIGHAIDDLTMKDNKFLFWTTAVNSTTVDADGVTVFDLAENDVRENIRNSVDAYVERNGLSLSNTNREAVVTALMTPNFSGFTAKSTAETVYNGVAKEYTNEFASSSTDATVFCGISDVYGGYTDNKLRGTYGHNNTYWTDSTSNYNGKQGKELFAEAFSRYMTSNDESIDKMEEYFPTATAKMEELLSSWQEGN